MAIPADTVAIRTKFVFLFILSLFVKSESGYLFWNFQIQPVFVQNLLGVAMAAANDISI
jgi:hypothetical protein